MLGVGAEIKAVDVGAVLLQQLLKARMDFVDIGNGIESQGNSALVGDDEDPQAGVVHPPNGVEHTRQGVKLFPAGYVASFWHLLVQNSVAVEEDRAQGGRESIALRNRHTAMIAKGMVGMPGSGLTPKLRGWDRS